MNHVCRFATRWTVVCQAPVSMGFSRQEYWRGWPCSPPGDLPNAEIEPASLLSWQVGSSTTWEAPNYITPLVKTVVASGYILDNM